MVIEKVAGKKMGEIQKGQHYFQISGEHLERLAECAKRMGESDLTKAVVRILDKAIEHEGVILVVA